MLKLLYCNLYYRPPSHPRGEGIGCEYTETNGQVPDGTVFLEDAGCVQEAERLLKEERNYLIDLGRERYQVSATDPTPG